MDHNFKDIEEAIERKKNRDAEFAEDYKHLKLRVAKLESQLKELKDSTR